MKKSLLFLALLFSAFLGSELQAAYTLRNGKIVDYQYVATLPVEDHYALGVKALEAKDWPQVVVQFRILAQNFPLSPYSQDAFYFIGTGYYYLDDMEFANKYLAQYLKQQENSRYFEDAFKYKLAIAEKFRHGAKTHLFGWHAMPKWLSGEDVALKIYDEVTTAIPSHELAAKAFFGKAMLLREMHNYRGAVEALQLLTKRFPKSELAAQSYLWISKIYHEQSQREFQNPDLLALGEINLKRFEEAFPSEEHVGEVAENLQAMRESYAKGLYETAKFYERTKKSNAAVLYYASVVHQYPKTHSAELAKKRLAELGQDVAAILPALKSEAPLQ